VGLTDFHPLNWPIQCAILDALGRGFTSLISVGRGLLFCERVALFEKQSKKIKAQVGQNC
jgi:hypothetical protein